MTTKERGWIDGQRRRFQAKGHSFTTWQGGQIEESHTDIRAMLDGLFIISDTTERREENMEQVHRTLVSSRSAQSTATGPRPE